MNTWPPAIVAVALIALVGAIMASAIWHDGVDKSLPLWTGISGLTGVVIGAIPSYFFHQQAQSEREQRAEQAQNEAKLRAAASPQTVDEAMNKYGYQP